MSSEPAIIFEWKGETELDDTIPKPKPASRAVPDWYKRIPVTSDGQRTVKLCSSFSDALRLGWMLPLPFDINYIRGEESVSCVLPSENGSVTTYETSPITHKSNSTFRQPEFKIDIPWKIQTPDGYSALITSPLNRRDTGLKAFSMLIDTDSHSDQLSIPAVGTQEKADIENGVPFLQVIPIKRDTILSNFDVTHSEESPELWGFWEQSHEGANNTRGFYRRFCWKPKPGQEIVDLSTEDSYPSVSTNGNVQSLLQTSDPVDEPEHTPKIACHTSSFDLFPKPKPANEYIPEWMRDPSTHGFTSEQDTQLIEWMRDSMQLGWVIPTSVDSQVLINDNEYDIRSNYDGQFKRGIEGKLTPTSPHSNQQLGAFHPQTPSVVKVMSTWFTAMPPGYSMLGCEPFNHMQEIIQSYAGLVDADRYMVDGNLLGNIRPSDGVYEIEAGEPAMLEIPIHRDSIITKAFIIP